MSFLSSEDRLRLVQGDQLASQMVSKLAPVAARLDLRFAPGVQVVMSTYRRPVQLKACLASIEVSMNGTGVPWLLIVGMDGPDPETQEVLKAHESGADRFIWVCFPKAMNVAQSKNRVLRLSKMESAQYPWLMCMDDDDVFMRGRVTELLPLAIKYGKKLAAGNWRYTDSHGTYIDLSVNMVDREEPCLPPPACLIHADLIPVDGRFFDEAVDVWEDMAAWRRLWFEHGIEVAPFLTRTPMFEYLGNPAQSASKPVEAGPALVHIRQSVRTSIRARFPLRSNLESVSTVCLGSSHTKEVILMLESFRRFELNDRKRPIHILCDAENFETLGKLTHLAPLRLHPVAGPSWKEGILRQFLRSYGNPSLEARFPPAVMAGKLLAAQYALREHPNTLIADGDMVFVGDLPDMFPEDIDASVIFHHGQYPGSINQTGYWQAGCVFVKNQAFIEDWLREFFTHPVFGEQHALMAIVNRHRCGQLPLGYDVGPWSVWSPQEAKHLVKTRPRGSLNWRPVTEEDHWEIRAAQTASFYGMSAGKSGIFWNGTRIRSFHCHTWPSESSLVNNNWRYNETLRLVILHLLKTSPDSRHRELVELYGPP